MRARCGLNGDSYPEIEKQRLLDLSQRRPTGTQGRSASLAPNPRINVSGDLDAVQDIQQKLHVGFSISLDISSKRVLSEGSDTASFTSRRPSIQSQMFSDNIYDLNGYGNFAIKC